MLPNQLHAESFTAYPPEARKAAVRELPLLQRLPLAFVPLLLREVVVFDWKFPAERRELDRQFAYLSGQSADDLSQAMAGFAQLRLSPDLERTDWVNHPAAFSEKLTAHLWATGQIDRFRAAALGYMKKVIAAFPDPAPATHRLGIVVFGHGVARTDYPVFRKLLPHGTLFRQVNGEGGGLQTLANAVEQRATKNPEPFGHWMIDGGTSPEVRERGIASISYAELSGTRAALQSRMQRTYESSVFDPEAFRTMLAQIQPEEIGLGDAGNAVLNRFQVSLLTEGSGTQVFATTFVQWAAREAMRRAQPLTLLARFTPRQKERPMNELLAESQKPPELDPQGSLIDGDLGAYYTWINQQRLSGAEQATFLAWLENGREAIAIGPSIGRGKENSSPVRISDLVARLA